MFDITDEDVAKMHFDVDTSEIEDNDEKFWNHQYTVENDDDGFPDYDESLKHVTNVVKGATNISFMDTDL